MAKKTLLVGSVLALALLAGCSGTNNGNASAASTSTTSSSSSSSMSSSSSSPSSTTSTTEETTSEEATSDDDSTADVVPAELDSDSQAWFGTMCTGLTGAITGMMGAMGGAMSAGADSTPASQQAAMATAYAGVGAAFTQTAADLEGKTPPGIDNGDQLATEFVAAFDTLGSTISSATETFAATPVTDDASLTAAMNALETEIETVSSELEGSFTTLKDGLTPEVGAAVEQLPECAILNQ